MRRDPAHARLPVIMLTARTTSNDKVDALETGVDDHVDKPFSPSVLVARIRALRHRDLTELVTLIHSRGDGGGAA